jgi:hypothetical protein
MAIHATAVCDPRIGALAKREVASREQIVRMAEAPGLVVALVAEEWRGRDEEPLVIRPVRVVAIEAAFDDRGVFPEKRSALFRVALITELIDTIGAQKRVRGRTVWRMTITAGDLAFEQRHVGALAKLCALLGVTGEAGLRDTLLREKTARRLFGHRIVAIATSEPLSLVGRSTPVDARCTRVASEAHAVHRLDARSGFASERNNPIAL